MSENRPLAVFVGHDAAPSKAFDVVKPTLEALGWQVEAFLGYGKVSLAHKWHDILNALNRADVACIGLSVPENNAVEEIAAANRMQHLAKPYGFYADALGAWKRPWFFPYMGFASFLFVLNEYEGETAKSSHKAEAILVSGSHEWEEASFPAVSRAEVRAKLGIADDETFLFLPGHKSVPISCYLLMSTIQGIHHPRCSDREWHVVFAPHPGDGVPPRTYAEPVLYTAFSVDIVTKDKRYVRHEVPDKKESELQELEGGMTSSEILVGADCIIESASTFCQSAAIQRIPVISLLSEVSKRRNVPVFGQREWEPVVQGVSLEASDGDDVAECLISRLARERSLIEKLQAAYYPAFKERGEFARRIAVKLNSFR